jgi:hypothetical protein
MDAKHFENGSSNKIKIPSIQALVGSIEELGDQCKVVFDGKLPESAGMGVAQYELKSQGMHLIFRFLENKV